MALEFMSVDWLAVVIAAVASFAFGWVWFRPLFGKIWIKGSGMSAKEAKKMHKDGRGIKMLWYFMGVLVYVFANVIGWIGAGMSDVFMLGIWIGIGFFGVPTLLDDVLWK